jgi:hypothetical protein
MNFLMTAGAQSNEIGFGIVSEQASRFDVVNLKFDETSAILTPPSITLKYLVPQFPIGCWGEL